MAGPNQNVRIYLAIRRQEDRSHIEDALVMDGFDVTSFYNATTLWDTFQIRPARIILSDRRFEDGLSGLELATAVRRDYPAPYCYIVLRSTLNHLAEIEEGLGAGADDYLIKPHNPVELRARILVGLRWLGYMDLLLADRNLK